jgi:hypothetical protein
VPITRGQGQSRITPIKEAGFEAIIRLNALLVRNVMRKYQLNDPYWHFDLNAGCGTNSKCGTDGSPIIAVRSLEELMPHHYAFFVDNDRAAVAGLLQRDELKPEKHFVIEGDNKDFSGSIPELIRARQPRYKWAFGTIYSDPNGTDVPLDALAGVAEECPRLDVLINTAVNCFKRNGSDFPIEDLPTVLRKTHWLVRRHDASDPWQWIMLLGRNFDGGDYKRLGFVKLDSVEGRAIVAICRRPTNLPFA